MDHSTRQGGLMRRSRLVVYCLLVAGVALGFVGCSKEPAEQAAPKAVQPAEKAAAKAEQPAEQAVAKGPSVPGFNGVMKLDVRDSKEDWTAFTPKKAPEGAPNFLFILYDDTGLAAWSPYGGRINMPTLDQLAANGLTYTQWHTTALCSPTRSTILTGRNHHLNGMAAITEAATGFTGANGRLPEQAATIGEILQDGGWSTFWLGKNHNVAEQDVASGATRKQWPLQKGFDRYYGFLGGETNQ